MTVLRLVPGKDLLRVLAHSVLAIAVAEVLVKQTRMAPEVMLIVSACSYGIVLLGTARAFGTDYWR